MEKINLIHRNYWIGILIAIIVCLLTMRYTADAQLKDYVSFAATLASLILAAFAIMQTMYSTTAMTNTMSILSDSSKKIEASTVDLTDTIASLQNKITNLPQEVGDRVHVQFNEFVVNREQDILQNNEAIAQQPAFTNQIDQRYFENYVRLGSINGLLLLYGISLSISTARPFRLRDLLPEEQISFNLENMSGYLISHTAAGFVLVSQQDELMTLSNSCIEQRHIDSAIALVVSNETRPALLKYFVDVKTHIDRLFSR